MADELQALLDKLTDEELAKADMVRKDMLGQADKEAKEIVANARKEAADIIEKAEREAEVFERKGREALNQAARDVLLNLRGTLNDRMKAVVASMAGAALSGDELGKILVRLMEGFLKTGGNEDRVAVLLDADNLAAVEKAMGAAFVEDLRKRCELQPKAGLGGGFKLEFSGEDVVYDFTDKALAESLAAQLSGKLAGIVTAL